MKLLSISTLFPNAADPKHGIFVETRLRHLRAEYPDIDLTVIAPVPWFPFKGARFGSYGRFADAPAEETRIGAEVHHPRYLVIPRIGMLITPLTLALSILLCLKRLKRSGLHYDLVDGHYLYPDGVAIALCRPWLKAPLFLTARGTDLNLIPEYALPRKLIRWAAARANGIITVCEALREKAIEIGIPPNNVTTLRNGVDLALFMPPDDREAVRRRLNISGFVILSVGHLIERKGHHLIIEALVETPQAQLLIAGDGPEREPLQRLVQAKGLSERVQFLGSLSQSELVDYYGAADALVLASSREGWANVLLEAMACGTPVVATRVWGTPEVIQTQAVGLLVDRDPRAIAAALEEMRQAQRDRQAVRQYAEAFDWTTTSRGQRQLFEQALNTS